jgi:hypothetical protein
MLRQLLGGHDAVERDERPAVIFLVFLLRSSSYPNFE